MFGDYRNHIFFTRNFCDRTRCNLPLKTHDVAPDPICLRPNSTVFGSNVASSPPAVTLILVLFPSICGECLLEKPGK